MFRLMEKARNNKGFSLVELIVVVLIIAISAVALAPQVMKYVGKARTGTQDNNAATIKSAVQVAVADYQDKGGTLDGNEDHKVTFTLTPGNSNPVSNGTVTGDVLGTSTTGTTNVATLKACIEETTGKDIPEVMDNSKAGTWTVTINGLGAVTVEAPDKTASSGR